MATTVNVATVKGVRGVVEFGSCGSEYNVTTPSTAFVDRPSNAHGSEAPAASAGAPYRGRWTGGQRTSRRPPQASWVTGTDAADSLDALDVALPTMTSSVAVISPRTRVPEVWAMSAPPQTDTLGSVGMKTAIGPQQVTEHPVAPEIS
ncbi:MAG: hypothetical protein ABI706_16880 [Ilumatobacteraceae bacterium]